MTVTDIVSPYLIAIAAAWIFAHLIKYIVSLFRKEKYKLRSHIFRSGGMPSAHSATTVALATLICLKEGANSALFAVAALLALIVMYDAVKVRRSAGEQGVAVHNIINEMKLKIKLPRIAKGHEPIEVVAGAMLGVVVGFVIFIVF